MSENAQVCDWATDTLRNALIDDCHIDVRCERNLRWPGMPACVLLDPQLGARRGYVLLQQARLTYPRVPVIVLMRDVVDDHLGEADAVIRCFAEKPILFSALVGCVAIPARPLSEHPSYPPPMFAFDSLLE